FRGWQKRYPLSALDRRGLERRFSIFDVDLKSHGSTVVLLNQLLSILSQLSREALVRQAVGRFSAALSGSDEVPVDFLKMRLVGVHRWGRHEGRFGGRLRPGGHGLLLVLGGAGAQQLLWDAGHPGGVRPGVGAEFRGVLVGAFTAGGCLRFGVRTVVGGKRLRGGRIESGVPRVARLRLLCRGRWPRRR